LGFYRGGDNRRGAMKWGGGSNKIRHATGIGVRGGGQADLKEKNGRRKVGQKGRKRTRAHMATGVWDTGKREPPYKLVGR